jgi:hypothetical protein
MARSNHLWPDLIRYFPLPRSRWSPAQTTSLDPSTPPSAAETARGSQEGRGRVGRPQRALRALPAVMGPRKRFDYKDDTEDGARPRARARREEPQAAGDGAAGVLAVLPHPRAACSTNGFDAGDASTGNARHCNQARSHTATLGLAGGGPAARQRSRRPYLDAVLASMLCWAVPSHGAACSYGACCVPRQLGSAVWLVWGVLRGRPGHQPRHACSTHAPPCSLTVTPPLMHPPPLPHRPSRSASAMSAVGTWMRGQRLQRME